MSKLLSPFAKERKIVHRVCENQTVTSIAILYGTTPKKIISLNNLTEPPEKNALLYIERGSNRLYLVRPSDSLEKIAAKTGVSSEELIRLNGADAFFPYSVIEIP